MPNKSSSPRRKTNADRAASTANEQGVNPAIVVLVKRKSKKDVKDCFALLPPLILSPREREVLCLEAEGLTSYAIGQRLSICEATVKGHRAEVYRKLGANNAALAIRIAFQRGILRLAVRQA